MAAPLTKRATDHSDAAGYSFGFFCDRCGAEWRSSVVPFHGGGFSEIEKDEAKRLLWADERRAAFIEANTEAHFFHNQCPVCARWVCDRCFLPGEDMCRDCEKTEKNTLRRVYHGK